MNHLKVCNSSVLISQDCRLKKEKFHQAGSLNNRTVFFHSSSQKPEMKAWVDFFLKTKALLYASSFGSWLEAFSLHIQSVCICLHFLFFKKKLLILWELCFEGREMVQPLKWSSMPICLNVLFFVFRLFAVISPAKTSTSNLAVAVEMRLLVYSFCLNDQDIVKRLIFS